MIAAKILIIEDDQKLVSELKKLLINQTEYSFVVQAAYDGISGLALAREWNPDVILLDLGLPKLHGLSLLRTLHTELLETKVCIITVADNLEDKLVGFQEGGDDYLVKPLENKEVVARIVALLRRGRVFTSSNLVFGELYLRNSDRTLRKGSVNIRLTPNEFKLISYLMRRPNQIVSRNELLDRVWDGKDLYPNIVDVGIESLRKKMDRPFKTDFVKTSYGKGYFFDWSIEAGL